jgi:hypothetical protein
MKDRPSTPGFREGTGRTRSGPSSAPDDCVDLCTTCNHRKDCLSRKTLRRPVCFCEEFDAYTPPPEPRATPQECADSNTDLAGQYTGICVNCDHREICRHACTEGGIWHCEEYC